MEMEIWCIGSVKKSQYGIFDKGDYFVVDMTDDNGDFRPVIFTRDAIKQLKKKLNARKDI